MSKDTEYVGPENNDFYAQDDGELQSFDDMGDDDDFEETEIQGGTSHDDMEDYDEEGNVVEEPAPPKSKRDKKEAEKKARGQKGDDMDALDLDPEEVRNIDEEDEEEETKKPEEEEDEEEEEEVKADSKEEKPKGKPTYVTIGEETYSLDSNALIATQVDGKTEKVTLQELKNNYAGKVAYDKRFNEVNLKEQSIKRASADLDQQLTSFKGVKNQIQEIIGNPEKNPKDAFKIFLDASGVDSYDLMERMFKSDLEELSNVLGMEPSERKAYFLERKNGHLQTQAEKRRNQDSEADKLNRYKAQTDTLRKSHDVSEAQYVDAYEELISYGNTDEDLTEKEIVEWAATKPHREEISNLMSSYKDQLESDAYGELSWKLVKILQSGTESPQQIKKHLAQVFGVTTEVKDLSRKLSPIGRRKTPPKATSKSSKAYESYDDIDEDD